MSSFTPTGKIILIKNVDIDSTYTHQYYFANSTAQYNFFYGKKAFELSNGTYQRKNINTISVPYCADDIADCKYLMWQNPTYANKWYYAFITSINYENPKTSIIRYELDVYQTFLFDMTWKKSFVEREHCDRYDSNNKPIVNVEVENLDFGSEYRTVNTQELTQVQNGDVVFAVLGCKKYNPGSGDSSYFATNMYYFIVPIWVGSGAKTFNLNNSDNLTTFPNVLKFFANDTTYVNTLVSLYVTTFLPLDFASTITGDVVELTSSDVSAVSLTGSTSIRVLILRGNYATALEEQTIYTGDKYANFPAYEESKLLMYPYSFVELTNNRGNSQIFKMEYIEDNNMTIKILATISTSNKIVTTIYNYLMTGGYDVENSLVDSGTDKLPILDDYTASYLQANSNSLAISDANAKLAYQTTVNNAQRTYNSTVAGLVGNAIGIPVEASISSGTSNGINSMYDVNDYMMNEWSNAGLGNTSVGRFLTGFSDFLTGKSTGNYRNALESAGATYQQVQASNLAKIQDANQVPPSSSQLGGDTVFNVAFNCNKIYVKKKTITSAYVNKLTDFFKQYGYKVNKLETPLFHTRLSWNYIKMAEPNVYGNIPMDDLLKIKKIFLNGITLWHGDYIGDYTRNNDEI